jgi:hypothetical protein
MLDNRRTMAKQEPARKCYIQNHLSHCNCIRKCKFISYLFLILQSIHVFGLQWSSSWISGLQGRRERVRAPVRIFFGPRSLGKPATNLYTIFFIDKCYVSWFVLKCKKNPSLVYKLNMEEENKTYSWRPSKNLTNILKKLKSKSHISHYYN